MAGLRFFFTGADKFLDTQPETDKSIGGFISSSPVPNDDFANVFSEISLLSITNDLQETKGLALKNETGVDITDLLINYVYPEVDSQTIVEIATVAVSIDACGDQAIEKIPNFRSTPQFATFQEANAAQARARMELSNPGSNGDTITIEVDSIPEETTIALPQANPTIEETVDAIVDAFAANVTYTVTKVIEKRILISTSTALGVTVGQKIEQLIPLVEFRKTAFGVSTEEFSLVTAGTATADPVTLAGGVDNTINVGPLTDGQYLGVWLRRRLRDSVKKPVDCEVLFDEFIQETEKPLSETIDVNLEWTEP